VLCGALLWQNVKTTCWQFAGLFSKKINNLWRYSALNACWNGQCDYSNTLQPSLVLILVAKQFVFFNLINSQHTTV
jgi:hypothetical protein